MAPGVEPPAACWLHSSNEELRLCARSMVGRVKGPDKRKQYLELLRRVGEASKQGDDAVQTALAALTPEARAMLLKYGAAQLRPRLAKRIAMLEDTGVRLTGRKVRIPGDLPEDLRDGLVAYQQRLEARYATLLERGHSRSTKYVADIVKIPTRLAVFLASIGIERWDIVRKRDLVAFFKRNPGAKRQSVDRFLRYMEDKRPFRDRRGRPAGGRRPMRESRRRPPPQVLRPEVLARFLADVRERNSDHEYVLAWMVCRLGMTATHAYRITLDRIRLNESGRMVIRPAQVWVEVPTRVAGLFRKLIETVEPNWSTADPESLRYVTVFDHYVSNLDYFSAKVLQGQTRLLRASAIYAAMLAGHLDRVTIRHTMGASMPMILQLERLLAVDLHRRLDPSLVEQRNAHITGQADA